MALPLDHNEPLIAVVFKVPAGQCHKEPLANPSRKIPWEIPQRFLGQSHTFFIKPRFYFENNSYFVLVENEHLATGNYETSAAHHKLSSSDPLNLSWCDRNTHDQMVMVKYTTARLAVKHEQLAHIFSMLTPDALLFLPQTRPITTHRFSMSS